MVARPQITGMCWSPSTGHFYHAVLNARDLPDDVVPVSNRRHVELIEGRALGRAVLAGPNGRPVLGPLPRITVEQRRRRAVAAIKAEARRRILAVASIERQTNDNAALLLGADPATTAAIADRRRRIDAIRTASNTLEARIASWAAAALDRFDATDASFWPATDEIA